MKRLAKRRSVHVLKYANYFRSDQDPQGALFSGVESDDIYREIRYRWLDMASEDANYFSSPMFGQALGIKVQVGDMDQQQDRYHKRR